MDSFISILYTLSGFLFICLPFFIAAKVLVKDWKLHLKESIYILLASLFTASMMFINVLLHDVFTHLLGSFSLILLLFLYFHKIKFYSAKKSVILMFLSYSIAEITAISVQNILVHIPIVFGIGSIQYLVLFFLLTHSLTIAVSVLFVRIFENLRKIVNQNTRLQTTLVCLSIFCLIFQYALANWWRFQGYTNISFSWQAIFVFSITVFLLIIFYFYAKVINTKHEQQRKDDAYQSLQYYTDELERQQIAVRKFEHDYRNILSSLDSFIEEDDFAGLKQYYMSKIKATSEIITQNHFALVALNKIKVKEIKSILSSKLMIAQSKSIDATFEADAEINHIPVDSVLLVRMIGIIMDNAIEELTELGFGTLRVGCFKEGEEMLLIVQNTCRPDMPPLGQLRQSGFSSKGKGRGFGLSNLFEIADSIPNLFLDTSIIENNFIQKITIIETEGGDNI